MWKTTAYIRQIFLGKTTATPYWMDLGSDLPISHHAPTTPGSSASGQRASAAVVDATAMLMASLTSAPGCALPTQLAAPAGCHPRLPRHRRGPGANHGGRRGGQGAGGGAGPARDLPAERFSATSHSVWHSQGDEETVVSTKYTIRNT